MSTPTIAQHIYLNVQNDQKLYQIPPEIIHLLFFNLKRNLRLGKLEFLNITYNEYLKHGNGSEF